MQNRLARWSWMLMTSLAGFLLEAAPVTGIRFPNDASVIDAQRDLGTVGDGVADDTAALQKGLEASARGKTSKVLFIPNGTYRVTQTLVVKASVGPWVYGESRDGVILRLADGITDTNCTAVLRTHPKESGPTSADWFMRNFRNLTIDVGNNPGIDGIRFFGNNSSLLKNIRVTGRGKVRERRGAETRVLDKKQEGGWIGWSLYSGWEGKP